MTKHRFTKAEYQALKQAGQKYCPSCEVVKPISDFYGSTRYCKVCFRASHPPRRRKKYHSELKWIRDIGKGNFWRLLLLHYAPGGKCPRCGEVRRMEIDHVIPFSVNGERGFSNVQPLCSECNAWKATQSLDFRPDGGEYARELDRLIFKG